MNRVYKHEVLCSFLWVFLIPVAIFVSLLVWATLQ